MAPSTKQKFVNGLKSVTVQPLTVFYSIVDVNVFFQSLMALAVKLYLKWLKDFILSKHIKNANLRKRNDFYIPKIKSIKIGLLPPHNFPKIWYENKRHFSKLSNINLISNLKQNLILTHAMFAKESKKAKTILQRKD